MDKITTFKALVFGSLGVWCVPIFVSSLFWVRYFSYVGMAGGILYFIAGDQLSRMFKRPTLSKEDYNLELQRLSHQLEVEKMKKELERVKAETKLIKNPVPVSGSKQESFKMPDLLGNLNGLCVKVDSKDNDEKSKSKKKQDLRDLF